MMPTEGTHKGDQRGDEQQESAIPQHPSSPQEDPIA